MLLQKEVLARLLRYLSDTDVSALEAFGAPGLPVVAEPAVVEHVVTTILYR